MGVGLLLLLLLLLRRSGVMPRTDEPLRCVGRLARRISCRIKSSSWDCGVLGAAPGTEASCWPRRVLSARRHQAQSMQGQQSSAMRQVRFMRESGQV